LTGLVWFDTYTVIIDLFKTQYPELCQHASLQILLNRNVLKKIIMIVNYNAGVRECTTHLTEYLREKNTRIEPPIFNEFIKTFYNFLNVDLFTQIYIFNKTEVVVNLKNKLELTDAKIDLTYYETQKIKREIKVREVR
jgi:hypothetical protein